MITEKDNKIDFFLKNFHFIIIREVCEYHNMKKDKFYKNIHIPKVFKKLFLKTQTGEEFRPFMTSKALYELFMSHCFYKETVLLEEAINLLRSFVDAYNHYNEDPGIYLFLLSEMVKFHSLDKCIKKYENILSEVQKNFRHEGDEYLNY